MTIKTIQYYTFIIVIGLTFLNCTVFKENRNDLLLYQKIKKDLEDNQSLNEFKQENKVDCSYMIFSEWENFFCSYAKTKSFEKYIDTSTILDCKNSKNEQAQIKNIKELNDKGKKCIFVGFSNIVDDYIVVDISLKQKPHLALGILYKIDNKGEKLSIKQLSSSVWSQ